MNLLKNRTVLGIVCITLSLLICFVITPFFNKEMAQKVEIVRVSQPILTGQTITKDMVSVLEVGGYNLPETVVKNTETVIGSYALADFSPGDFNFNDFSMLFRLIIDSELFNSFLCIIKFDEKNFGNSTSRKCLFI